MNILLAPNAFKEAASSIAAVKLLKKYLSKNSRIHFIEKPISDGGDGFLEIIEYYFQAKQLSFQITKAYSDELFECPAVYNDESQALFVESAEVLGLKTIPKDKRNPLQNSSKGMGELLLQILKSKFAIKKIVIGVGGTGTNDLGLGLCSRFGLKLFDDNDNPLKVIPKNFSKAKRLIWNKPDFLFDVEAIVDVENPLLGDTGATLTFGSQKGASENDLKILEAGFENIVELANKEGLIGCRKLSGAGGGLAAGLQIFFNAKLKTAEDFILNDLNLKDASEKTDILITGEGTFDKQSFMNKGSGILLNLFKEKNKPAFVICGVVKDDVNKDVGNVKIIEMQKFFSSKNESMEKFEEGIAKACEEILAEVL